MHNHRVVQSLNDTFLALSDPTRRIMLERLRRGSASIVELGAPFAISQQALSRHVAVLERAALIEKRREGRAQVCSLRAKNLRVAWRWLETYRQFWDLAFDRLDDVLVGMNKPTRKRKLNHGRQKC